MSLFGRTRRPKLSREDALAARPRQSVEAQLVTNDDGTARLTIPIRAPARFRRLFKYPEGATKSFELDAIGKLVWEQCDGMTSVMKIIRRLSKQLRVGHRQAEVPTVAFLQTLARKGLIGFAINEERSDS